MKLIKCAFKIVLWLVAIVLVLVLTLPLWVGPVTKMVANSVVPMKTGTPFMLGEFGLNPYVGKLHVGAVRLANPEGFVPPVALTLGKFSADVEPLSLASGTIVVKDITLTDLFVSYVVNAKGETNIGVIERNATGGEKKAEKAKPDGGAKAPEAKGGEKAEKAEEEKIIIDHLLIDNVTVQLGPLPIPMPKIELRDIGRKSNGVTMAEAWDQVYDQISKNFNALGINLNGLIDGLGTEALNQALKSVDPTKLLEAKGVKDVLESESVKGVLDVTGKSLDATSKATSQTIDATSKATTQTLGAATEAASQTTTKTVDAVNKGLDAGKESATKAIDAIKGLF